FRFLWFALLASTLRCRRKSTGWYELLRLMTHRINDVIETKTDGARTVPERLLTLIKVFPVIADVIVVIGDQLDIPVFVRQSPELRRPVAVRCMHVLNVNVEEAVKDRMFGVEADEFSLRNSSFQVVAQNVQFLGPVKKFLSAKIIGHDESATPDVFAEICNFF